MNRSLILSDWQVKAALDGRLTQVRLPVVPQPSPELSWIGWMTDTTGSKKDVGKACWAKDNDGILLGKHLVRSPYAVGDTVWAKETWTNVYEDVIGNRFTRLPLPNDRDVHKHWIEYAATPRARLDEPIHWNSPILMPRWASRISRVITAVRVERVQDVSVDDIKAMGIEDQGAGWAASWIWRWNTRYARRGYGWEDNPWCWVYTWEKEN